MTRAPWVSHFGFTHTPFGKSIPANKLCDRASHQGAVARIRFCVAESLLGVITGEVGVGKTVAIRAATSQLDPTAHHVIYISTPTFGARGLYVTIVGALGARPRLHRAELIPQAHAVRRAAGGPADAGAAVAHAHLRGARSTHRLALSAHPDGFGLISDLPPP